jgi:hypothetical protein
MAMNANSKKAHEKRIRIGSTGPYMPEAHRKVERQLKLERHAHAARGASAKKAQSARRKASHPLTDAGTR